MQGGPARQPSLGELMAVLSLGVDLGLGQPMDHMLGSCVVSLGLAAELGLEAADVEMIHYLALLAYVGCHADSMEQARWFGDDIELRARSYAFDETPLGRARRVMPLVGSDRGGLDKARTVAGFLASGRKVAERMPIGHCDAAGKFALRLGLPEEVRNALLEVFERWDGKGDPGTIAGPAIRMAVRVFRLADVIEVYYREGGLEGALGVARARSGTQFDPELVELFCSNAAEILEPLHDDQRWDTVIAGQPGLDAPLSPDEASAALEAIADFVDLKSPFLLGHSRAVADLAAEAAGAADLPSDQVANVRTAGLLHDLGRLGIANTIWDKPGPLTASERERVRLQPYLTERMVASSPTLAPLAPLAAAHQERLDGSGYPRGLRADATSKPARILAAADVYRALIEPRPHREAHTPADAARTLRAEARAGRLDGEAVEAVLHAAGQGGRERPGEASGLTPREIEVLGLLARGMTSKAIGERLFITTKTVGHHISSIYMKTGATNRVSASIYATEHGLLGPPLDGVPVPATAA